MKRVKKSLRAYQLLSSAFTAAIVVAAVALLSVAGASDAGNLTDAELFKSLSVVSGGFAIAYLGKHICTKNIQALERRIDRYIERRGMVDTFTMSSGVRMAHFELSVPKGKETVRTGRILCRRSALSDTVCDTMEDWLLMSGLPSIYAGDAVWFSDDHQTWKLVERAVEGDDVVLYERVPAKRSRVTKYTTHSGMSYWDVPLCLSIGYRNIQSSAGREYRNSSVQVPGRSSMFLEESTAI